VGAGRLGTAIAEYPGFEMFGFEIAAIFDNDPGKIGTKIGKNTVEDIAKMGTISNREIYLAILAVPARAAQSVVDMLVGCRIKGILNLSPCYLVVPKQIKVITIDLAMELGILPYYM
jgi:redox-sensing transcriptional repressor